VRGRGIFPAAPPGHLPDLQEIEDGIPDPFAGLLDCLAIGEAPRNGRYLGEDDVFGLPIDHLMAFNILGGNGGGDRHVKRV
jgi:hypothetical protein